jgi:hypothetical protein
LEGSGLYEAFWFTNQPWLSSQNHGWQPGTSGLMSMQLILGMQQASSDGGLTLDMLLLKT